MRILHVGYGYRPWLVTGLIIHVEAVMDGQASQGDDVAYFFSGRQLPYFRRPFVHRWRRRGVEMLELVNSSLVVGRHRGTLAPDQDLDHPASEALFFEALQRFAPELVHVHDLGGLPSSILEIARGHGVPTVMTLHDYHPLCPTVKLYDAHDRICLRPDPGAMCAVCCADAPVDNHDDLAGTLIYGRRRLRAAIPGLDSALRRPAAEGLAAAGIRLIERGAGLAPRRSPQAPGAQALAKPPRASADDYQRRREVNLARLNRTGALISYSNRAAEIYRQLGVGRPPIHVIAFNPPHIASLQPKRPRVTGQPMRFVVLNAAQSTQKGAELIAGALSILSERGLNDRFRLSVHGSVAEHVLPALAAHPSVELHGDYTTEELDRLLEHGDVGLLPSVWEEVYGYVGLEFLAKGIPVIGNAIGAIPEYVRPGQTGWLNHSGSADELAELMVGAIEHPEEVERLGETALELRGELIKPFASALARLGGVYGELIAGRGYLGGGELA